VTGLFRFVAFWNVIGGGLGFVGGAGSGGRDGADDVGFGGSDCGVCDGGGGFVGTECGVGDCVVIVMVVVVVVVVNLL
jgi:hypothetical protein